MNVVEIRDLSILENEKKILNNINISLKGKSIYGIIGSDFSGRKELLKSIAGIITKYNGSVKVLGSDLKDKDLNILDSLGVAFSDEGFINEYTGFKNLKVISSIKGVLDNDDITDVFYILNIVDLLDKKFKEYEEDEKKKLLIAQAIMEKPKVLIIDDPFKNLDEKYISYLINIFYKLTEERKITVILGLRNNDYIDENINIYTIENGFIKE